MMSVKFQGRQRFCNRLQFEHPSVMICFRNFAEVGKKPTGPGGLGRASRPPKMITQIKVSISCIQLNLGVYFTVSKMHMFQRLVKVRGRYVCFNAPIASQGFIQDNGHCRFIVQTISVRMARIHENISRVSGPAEGASVGIIPGVQEQTKPVEGVAGASAAPRHRQDGEGDLFDEGPEEGQDVEPEGRPMADIDFCLEVASTSVKVKHRPDGNGWFGCRRFLRMILWHSKAFTLLPVGDG